MRIQPIQVEVFNDEKDQLHPWFVIHRCLEPILEPVFEDVAVPALSADGQPLVDAGGRTLLVAETRPAVRDGQPVMQRVGSNPVYAVTEGDGKRVATFATYDEALAFCMKG